MKQLMEMQKKMQELKRELDNTDFDISSPDGVVKITMNGSQEIKEVSLSEISADKPKLEKAIKEAYNAAIKRAQGIAADKMKKITGFNLPGLT